MSKTISIEEARKRLGDVVEEVRLKGDFYIISRKGKPSAAIVPLDMVQRREAAKNTLLHMIEDVHKRNAGRKQDEIEALIEEAVRVVRTRKMK